MLPFMQLLEHVAAAALLRCGAGFRGSEIASWKLRGDLGLQA